MKIRRFYRCYEVELHGLRDDGVYAPWRIQVQIDDHMMPWLGIIPDDSPEGYGGHVRPRECLAIAGLLAVAAADGAASEVAAWGWVERLRAKGVPFVRRVRMRLQHLHIWQRVHGHIHRHLHVDDTYERLRGTEERFDQALDALWDWHKVSDRLGAPSDTMSDADAQRLILEHVARLAKVFGLAEPESATLADIVGAAETNAREQVDAAAAKLDDMWLRMLEGM